MGVRKQFCPAGHDTFVVGRVPAGQCRTCCYEAQAKYNASPEGKAIKAKARAKYGASPESRAAHAKYRASHREEAVARCKAYYASHREESLHQAYTYYHAKGYLKRINRKADAAMQNLEAIYGGQ